MIGRLALVLAGLSLASSPVLGVEVVETVFQTTYTHGGKQYAGDGAVVPLLPGNACYGWYLRVAGSGVPVRAVERFTLPAPLTDWGTTGSTPEDRIQLEDAGKVAVTTLDVVSDNDGWVSHGWCVAEGDPLGLHLFDVSVDGASVARFEFEVVAPENYAFPAMPAPDPSARSSNNSW